MQASSIEVAEERDAQRQQALRNALPVHLRDIVDLGLSKDKGCVLIARRAFEIGDLIFEEDPLLFVSPSAYAQSTIDLLQAICREANLSALLSTASADDDHFVSVRTILPTLQFLREDADTQRKVLLMFCPPEPTVPPLFLRVLRHAIALLLARGVADPAAAAAAGRRHASSAAAVLERVALVCQCNIFAVTDDASESALCLAAGVMSHACLPACNWHFTAAGRYQLRAACAVAPGDELTVSYLEAER